MIEDTQDPFATTDAVDIQNNGSPNTIDGRDHNFTVDGSGNVSVVLDSDQTKAAPAAIGLSDVTPQWVNGTGSNSANSGITIDGIHNDANVEGGVSNTLSKDKQSQIEAFIESVKNAADYTIDLSQGGTDAVSTTSGQVVSLTGNTTHIGGPDDFKVVYAKGRNVNGVFTEKDLHLSGGGTSYGVLVVEIDNPDDAQVIFSGQYSWVGLVLVVAKKRPTGTKPILALTGGGAGNHVAGGAMVYMRNHRNSASNAGSIYGKELYRTSGTSDLKFSFDALNNIDVESVSSVQIRSWRVVQPGQ
ncbi:MAG: hypothetical protein HS116_12010 [Planctomycetes bacterium]|nr:hypothetical protein [Planctomycetota bacterium]